MSINIFMKEILKKLWMLLVDGFAEMGSFWWITW